MSYRQMIAPLRSDGSDFHTAPNTLVQNRETHRCDLCGWKTSGATLCPHRRRADGKGWEVVNTSYGLIVFDPAPLISEEQAFALIKNVNVDLKVPCQNCARYGGRYVSHKVSGGHVNRWECPHCLIHEGGVKENGKAEAE